MSYETIGRCEQCRQTGRYLAHMEYVETEEGFASIDVCAYGCDHAHSKAQPITGMVNKLVQLQLKQLKLDLKQVHAMPGAAARHAAAEDVRRNIERFEDIQKYSAMNRLNVDDWSRIMSVAHRRASDTGQKITQRLAMRKTAKCLADVERLEDDRRLYYELYRYAKGQCM